MTSRKRLEICPLTITDAKQYVVEWHRHHKPPQGALFAIGLSNGEEIVGCAIVGRPVARNAQDGWTAEVTRLCTNGTSNACSMLYAASWRAARAMGYRRLITYILDSEPGTSLKAAGWRLIGQTQGGSWSRLNRPRIDKHPLQRKLKWGVGVITG